MAIRFIQTESIFGVGVAFQEEVNVNKYLLLGREEEMEEDDLLNYNKWYPNNPVIDCFPGIFVVIDPRKKKYYTIVWDKIKEHPLEEFPPQSILILKI